MSNPAHAYQPAIDDLDKELAELERRGNAVLGAVNVLRAKAGLPPRPGFTIGAHQDAAGASPVGQGDGATASTQLRSDLFFGKRMQTAAREYLEMRRADGAAKTRDIYEGLKAGGFQFETKDDTVAMVSLRNMLRKRTEVFTKLPNGTYGLKTWYPHAKAPKSPIGPEQEKDDDPPSSKSDRPESAAASAAA